MTRYEVDKAFIAYYPQYNEVGRTKKMIYWCAFIGALLDNDDITLFDFNRWKYPPM
jgi:hypothetical protein